MQSSTHTSTDHQLNGGVPTPHCTRTRTRVDRQPLAEVLPGRQPHRILHRPRAQRVLNVLLERQALGAHRHILDRAKGAALPAHAASAAAGGGQRRAAACAHGFCGPWITCHCYRVHSQGSGTPTACRQEERTPVCVATQPPTIPTHLAKFRRLAIPLWQRSGDTSNLVFPWSAFAGLSRARAGTAEACDPVHGRENVQHCRSMPGAASEAMRRACRLAELHLVSIFRV